MCDLWPPVLSSLVSRPRYTAPHPPRATTFPKITLNPGEKKKKIHQPAVYTAVINTLLMPVDSKIGKENLFSPRPSDCPITDNIYNRVNVDNHLSISKDFFVYHFGFFFDKAENQRLV